jgi:hypothetical protein
MATADDYIPAPDNEFKEFQGNIDDMVTDNEVAWGIPNAVVLELNGKRTAYDLQYTTANTPSTRTTGTIAAHRAGRVIHEKYIRAFVKAHLAGNTAITVEQRKNLGINMGDNIRSVRPKINVAPNVILKALGGQDVLVECRRPEDESRPSMHPDADVIEFRGAISSVPPGGTPAGTPFPIPGDPPPASWKEALDVSVSTKARFTRVLGDPELAGKYMYIFARYKNNSDDRKSGPWSEVAHVRII